MTDLRASLFRCQRCGYTSVLAIHYPARAPHGPDKTCRSDSWELVKQPLPTMGVSKGTPWVADGEDYGDE